jgi:hypothetical protein
MKAGLGRFLWLWLVPLAVFLAGLWRAFLTGQVDPWDWGTGMPLGLAGAGVMLARRGWTMLVWVALGSVGMVLIFCGLAAGRAPDVWAAAGLLAVATLAAVGGALLSQHPFGSSLSRTGGTALPASRLRSKRTVGAMAALIVAALLLWRGPLRPLDIMADRPTLAVVTGLPLFWEETGQGGKRDAPILRVLRTRFTLLPLDDPARLSATGARLLLLAQPRALSPAQLVAVDRWVRGGGRALVLADPLLRWPFALPLGDRRRAPATSLLAPLLDHWGFPPDGPLEPQEMRHFLPDGALLTLSGAARGRVLPERRAVGSGTVLLVRDADLLDDRLWLAEPDRPLDPRVWSADTPGWVAAQLGASMPSARRWMRAPGNVTRALRWAMLAGTGWAMLGALLLRRIPAGSRAGTKRENRLAKAEENG